MAKYDDHQSSSYDTEYCSWSNSPDVDFALSDDNDWYIGQFVWTGFDYLGEPTPYNNDSWPSHSSLFGIIDLANLPKDRYYLYRSVWNNTSHTLHVLPHWTWPGREGQVTPVMVYTDCPEAELFINGVSQGRRRKWNTEKVSHEHDSLRVLRRYRLIWDNAVYMPGELKVVGYDISGQAADSAYVRTAGKPHRLKVEQLNNDSLSDCHDLILLRISMVDCSGVLCPHDSSNVIVSVLEGGELVGIANGDPTCLVSLASHTMPLFNGELTCWVRRHACEDVRVIVESVDIPKVKIDL